jgi:hypothetical protein
MREREKRQNGLKKKIFLVKAESIFEAQSWILYNYVLSNIVTKIIKIYMALNNPDSITKILRESQNIDQTLFN